MSASTRVLLVLLQLSVGCHFLYEGVWKIRQGEKWSSKGYLQSATGPFALPIRWLAGDPDVTWQDSHLVVIDRTPDLFARFAVQPFDPHKPPEKTLLHNYMPTVLAQEWQDYFNRFVEHYRLQGPEKANPQDPNDPRQRRDQKALAERAFETAENETVDWLLHGIKKVTLSHLSGPAATIPKTTPERLQAYRDKLQQVDEIEAREMATFGQGIRPKLRLARQEASALRADLLADLNAQTAEMKRTLWAVLTPQQKRMPRVAEPAAVGSPTWSRLASIDWLVCWGLTAVGIGLLVGLLTRTACVAGALFLLLIYLAHPPLLGSVAGPLTEGHYLLINMNIIEILVLLVLASTRPASRYGLDAWLSLIRWRRRAIVQG